MATRRLTAHVLKADGTPFTGVLRVTPLEEIFADGSTVAVAPVEFAVTAGALPPEAAVVAPGPYAFALVDEGTEIQCFQAYVPAGGTEISLFDLIAGTYLYAPPERGPAYLVEGSSITLLGTGSGTNGQFLTITNGSLTWTDVAPGGSAASYTYIAYADDDQGTGFTMEFDPQKDYIAIRTTTLPLVPPVVTDFEGLWKKYKGEPGEDGRDGEDGVDGKDGADGQDGVDGQNGRDGEDGVSSYTYIGYAQDDQGTGFTTVFHPSLDYIAIRTTTEPLMPPTAIDFSGLWKKYKGEQGNPGQDGADGSDGQDGGDGQDGADGTSAYVYIGYASDAAGTDFTTVFDPGYDYIAIRSTTEPLTPPLASDFAGLWKRYKGEPGEPGQDGDDGADGSDGASAFVYIAYASAVDGTGFTTVFHPALDYIAIRSTTAPIAAPAAADFAGLWKKYKGEPGEGGSGGGGGDSAYVYIGYASDANGSNFTRVFDPVLDYIAIRSTTSPIASPTASDFAGPGSPLYFFQSPAGADGADGNDGASSYTYIAYASNASGAGFTTVFDPALDYIAIRATTVLLSPPTASDFAGRWKKYKGEPGPAGSDGADGQDGSDGASAYVYIAYASAADGTGFTTTFNPLLDYIAIRSTSSPIVSPSAADFAGLWKRYKGDPGQPGQDGNDGADGSDGADGASAYIYIAYAAAADGTGFTTTFNPLLDYIAIKTTTAPIASPAAGNFSGLWKKYKGDTGAAGQNGSDGQDGNDGAPGAAGSRWYTGIGAPVPGIGGEGDFYLDGDTGDVFEKVDNTWSHVANIKGAEGDPGGGAEAGGYTEYAHIEERKSAGQHGGNATAGSDEVRLFNTVVTNNSGLSNSTLLDGATGTVRLVSGRRYHIRGMILCSLVDSFKAIVRSIDGTMVNFYGLAVVANSNFGVNVPAQVECYVDVPSILLDVRILHRVERTQPVTGRGNALNAPGGSSLLGGAHEKYGTLVIESRPL